MMMIGPIRTMFGVTSGLPIYVVPIPSETFKFPLGEIPQVGNPCPNYTVVLADLTGV